MTRFWRSPIFREKFHNVPAFLLPRLTKIASEVPSSHLGRRMYYERVHCLITLASTERRTNPASFLLTEPPANAERDLGAVLVAQPDRSRPGQGEEYNLDISDLTVI